MAEAKPEAAPSIADLSPELVARFRLDEVDFERPARPTAELLRLDGRTALVTGGGGGGSGAAICHRLAEQGANLAVLDFNPDAAAATAEAVAARWGVETLAVQADVADLGAVRAAVEAAEAKFGAVDVLVNNAGGSGALDKGGRRVTPPGGPFAEMAPEDLDAVVRVNLLGVYLVTQAVLAGMLERGRGRIVNISSDAGRTAEPGLAVYASCKAAVISFTQNLAVEVGRSGVSTVAVCPGTMLNARAIANAEVPSVTAMIERYWEAATVGRFSVPDEVASMVAFLASEAGSYVHGTAISVSGGQAGV